MKLLRDPLVHFLVLGGLLFVLYGVVAVDEADDLTIVITDQDIARLTAQFEQQWRRPPLEEELQKMLDAEIRDRVLLREALALGLDEGDPVVRKRLVQKMEYFAQDVADVGEPSEEDLQAFLEAHPERFGEAPVVRLSQVYFRTTDAGAADTERATRIIERLEAAGLDADLESFGDGLRLDNKLVGAEWELARLFGAGFAAEVMALNPGVWHGPVASGYGLHVVFIHERRPAVIPALDEVREQVREAWIVAGQRAAGERFTAALIARYPVTIEADLPDAGP